MKAVLVGSRVRFEGPGDGELVGTFDSAHEGMPGIGRVLVFDEESGGTHMYLVSMPLLQPA